MVTDDQNNDAARYEELQDRWPAERPSRKRQRQTARRQNRRGRIYVRAERLEEPDAARLSRALLAAQRELARAQAEVDAREQRQSDATGSTTDGEEPEG